MTTRLTILGRLPGLNEYTAANRGNRYGGAQLKADTEDAISWQVKGAAKVRGPVRIHFDWYEPDRRRDPDNVRFAAKFVLDVLVRLGIIEADSQRIVKGLSDDFLVDKVRPRVEVTVTEVTA